jgi:hypothetical protein
MSNLIHHATAKRAATLGLTLEIAESRNVNVLFEGTVIASAENGKAALAAAEEKLEESGYEDFADLAADLQEQDDAEGDEGDEDDGEIQPEAEDGEEEGGARTVVPHKYRVLYKEIGLRGQDNGDAFVQAFIDVCGEDKGDDLKAILFDVAAANGVQTGKWAHHNPGQVRMNLGNILRAKVRRGEEVRIGKAVFRPTAEDKAKLAEKAAEAARKAKVKKDRAAAKADKAEAKVIRATAKAAKVG